MRIGSNKREILTLGFGVIVNNKGITRTNVERKVEGWVAFICNILIKACMQNQQPECDSSLTITSRAGLGLLFLPILKQGPSRSKNILSFRSCSNFHNLRLDPQKNIIILVYLMFKCSIYWDESTSSSLISFEKKYLAQCGSKSLKKHYMYLRPGQFKTQPSPSYHNLDSYYDNIIHSNMHFGVTAMLLCWMIISLTLFGLSQRKYNSYYSIEV